MSKFDFKTVPNISVASGASSTLANACSVLGISKPFIVTDPGILKFNLLDAALASLDAEQISSEIYSDIIADPPESILLAAVEQAKTSGCDGVIGFGGGSSMDVAKLVAVLATGNQALSEIYGVDQVKGDRLPLVQVPTTSGTGSEATAVAIITTGESTKAGVVSAQLYADSIILDPDLTLGLPAHVTAATGIDAMVHAIEAFTSKRLKNPISDMLALNALRLMTNSIKTAVKQGDDLAARTDMLVGAMWAGQAFSNAPVGAVHALAYPLGGTYHIPHGLSNSLVLPHVLRFNGETDAHSYQQIADIILDDYEGNETDVDVIALERVTSLADHFLNLAADLGLQTTLREMDIPIEDLDLLAEQSMLQQRLLINNPREVLYDDALNIYRQAF